jgi:polyphosphate kinase
MERASLRMVNHRRAAHDEGTTGDAASEVSEPAAGERTAPDPRPARPARPARRPAQHSELEAPELYINEELARLAFNRRVLAQAEDPSTPLLERLRFLTICSSNLDEFFEIRVAGLQQKVAFGLDKRGPDGLATEAVLERIAAESHRLVAEQYRVLNEVLLPALEKEGIRLLRRSGWNTRQAAWVRAYFRRNVLPILTPVGLDPAHPFPRVLNKGLNFIVSVEGGTAGSPSCRCRGRSRGSCGSRARRPPGRTTS